MKNSFSKEFRLLNSEDFNYLRKGARSFTAPYFRFYYKNTRISNITHSRLGLSVSKKVGKAHFRNSVKRLIRENYRHSKAKDLNLDILVIASFKLNKLSKSEIANEIDLTFKKFLAKNEIRT